MRGVAALVGSEPDDLQFRLILLGYTWTHGKADLDYLEGLGFGPQLEEAVRDLQQAGLMYVADGALRLTRAGRDTLRRSGLL